MVWGPLLLILALFLLSVAVGWLGALVAGWPTRRAEETNLAERVRQVYPARRSFLGIAAALTLIDFLFVWKTVEPLCPVPAQVLALLAALAGYAGVALVFFRVQRDLRQGQRTLGEGLRTELVNWIFLRGLVPVLFVLLVFMPDRFDMRAALLLAVAVLAIAFFGTGGGFFILRLLGLIQPAPARLQAIAAQTAAKMGLAVPSVSLIILPAANAFAVPFLGRIVFTPRLLEILDEAEIQAICAHELAHLGEPLLVRLARIAVLFMMLPAVAAMPLTNLFGFWPAMAYLAALLLAFRLMQGLARQQERRADRFAADQQKESGTYPRALARLYEANFEPLVGYGKGGTHPHLYDRLVAAGTPPLFPRPPAPSWGRRWLAMILSIGVVVSFWVGLLYAGHAVRQGEDETSILWVVALRGDAPSVSTLAFLRNRQKRYHEAAVFYQAAGEIDPDEAFYPANQAIVLASLKRCQEAEQAVLQAQARLSTSKLPGSDKVVGRAKDVVRFCKEEQTE